MISDDDLGVVSAIICDQRRQRFLLERKVNHPDPLYDGRLCLIGGSREYRDEATTSVWRREASEEWTDPASLAVALALADRTLLWRCFCLQVRERPRPLRMEIVLIELNDSDFDQFSGILVSNNCSQSRPEGWPQVFERPEIPELPLLSGHRQVLEAFLKLTQVSQELPG